MRVLFVSECKGRALKTTRRVLDMYATRTGSKTWLTEITEKGLETVRKDLASNATRDTAVQCLVVNRRQNVRKWIVGNRDMFGPDGEYPVARTAKDCSVKDESSWSILPLVSSLTAVAALLHDIGKLNLRFQKKLRGIGEISDPVRHEYLSCMLLRLFVEQVGAVTDKDWIEKLPGIDIAQLFPRLAPLVPFDEKLADPRNPFLDMKNYPVYMSLCWLIVSHHRLPFAKGEVRDGLDLDARMTWENLAYYIYGDAGYVNATESSDAMRECLTLSTPFDSARWRNLLSKHCKRLVSQMELHREAFERPDYLLLTLSRMCLVIGDHNFSARDCRSGGDGPWANTIKEENEVFLNQTLEQHLTGVCSESLQFAHTLPKMSRLDRAYDIEWLEKRSVGRFRWQERAANVIADKKKEMQGGMFVVNIAGTGSGKTLGNAKILHALSGEGLRGTYALGLRTLTFQTGREYREKLGLCDDDLCVAMGAFEAVELEDAEKRDEDSFPAPLVDPDILGGRASEAFSSGRGVLSKFLGSPMLVCTIDQMIKATEANTGGRGMIPLARLLSSDLVIDEVDDYTDKAMVSIGRLVYLAGAAGRNVVISSATIPPEMGLNLKHYYDLGYREFSKWNGKPAVTAGVIIDEHRSDVFETEDDYHRFCRRHVGRTSADAACRKAEVAEIPLCGNVETDMRAFFTTTLESMRRLHLRHSSNIDGKNVSFGLVRFANIMQLVEFAKFLGMQDDHSIKAIVYHARFPLPEKHYIESYLDRVLCRKDPEEIYRDPVVSAHIAKAETDVMFVVLASPVEELGRDHDFDWAVIEPSSYRSIIQTVGRVQRHRLIEPAEPNVAILQYNMAHITNRDGLCFRRPGFESDRSDRFALETHDMKELCDESFLAKGITSAPRILPCCDLNERFAILEHEVTHDMLDPDDAFAGKVRGYVDGFYMTGIPVKEAKLRESELRVRLIYKRNENRKMDFVFASDQKKRKSAMESRFIEFQDDVKLYDAWIEIDHDEIIASIAQRMDRTKARVENRYSIIDIPDNSNTQRKFFFNQMLGMYRMR